jgi:hypothetical protein
LTGRGVQNFRATHFIHAKNECIRYFLTITGDHILRIFWERLTIIFPLKERKNPEAGRKFVIFIQRVELVR